MHNFIERGLAIDPTGMGLVSIGNERETKQAKWLLLEDIYYKFLRPNLYDIGGTCLTNNQETRNEYWFSFKTEQVGDIYLLHIFIFNHDEYPFSVSLSSSNALKLKPDAVYLAENIKHFSFESCKPNFCNYLMTYSFTNLDLQFFKGRKLYISVSFEATNNSNTSDNLVALDFGALLEDPVGSDFTIETSEGKKFPVHKTILASQSEVFKAMLKTDTAESQNNYVKFVDVSEEDLGHLLEYVYTGTVKNLDEANFGNLLRLADRFNLKGLWELSQYVLSQQLNAENALEILILADLHDSFMLKINAMKFLKKNEGALKTSLNVSPDLMKELCLFLRC